jgi:hypothetical protein
MSIYANYYSSSDAQIYFFSSDSQRFIKVDTTVAIAYNLTQTSTPIYSLGTRTARYFSIGNTVCNGVLALAFTDEEYIKYCINYVASVAPIANTNAEQEAMTIPQGYSSTSKNTGQLSNSNFKNKSDSQLTDSSVIPENQQVISIGAIGDLFDIKIFLNNENAFRTSDSKVLTLKAVKLVGDSMEINSSADAYLTGGYKFIFKDLVRE